MSLSRREAIVGAVAAAVAPKLPIPAVPEYVNPWASAAAMCNAYSMLISYYDLHVHQGEFGMTKIQNTEP